MTASLIVFVKVMKELPTTLNLRPLGVETLATHVYQYASSEQLAPASPAALLIVFVGVWQVLFINHMLSKKSYSILLQLCKISLNLQSRFIRKISVLF